MTNEIEVNEITRQLFELLENKNYRDMKPILNEMAEADIACNVHYKPLPMHTAYKNLGFDIKDYPNAYAHFANEVTLPLHTRLTDEDVAYIADNFVEVVKEYI